VLEGFPTSQPNRTSRSKVLPRFEQVLSPQQRLRIAIWHNLPSGGGKRALYHHVKGLVQRGHILECWTLTTADQSYLPLKDLVVEHVIPYDSAPEKTFIRKIGRTYSSYYDGVARMRAFDEACKQCAREIEAGEFDLLFANSSLLYFMPYIMRHVRMPKVLYLQEPYRPLYEADPILPWVDSTRENMTRQDPFRPRVFIHGNLQLRSLRLQAKVEWLNAQACDVILVNSYYSRESILRAYGRDAKVCYLGVDTTRFRDLHREREHFIVGVGSFDKIKGIGLTIRSVALLLAPRPRLVWVANSGSESYMKEMLELAETVGVDLQIKMMVSDEELVDILNRASLLLYTPRLEPFGFAPLEANACATPVVAVAEGGVRETVKDGVNGFLVDREPENIAAALDKLLSDNVLARQMGDRAAAHVRDQWSVERSVDRLESHLLQTLSAHSGRKRR
jgi:glycosyltransferase involved in cell wall biosynthesis